MHDPTGVPRLAIEPPNRVGIADQVRRQHLERTTPADPDMLREIHSAHPALPQQLLHPKLPAEQPPNEIFLLAHRQQLGAIHRTESLARFVAGATAGATQHENPRRLARWVYQRS